MFGVGPTEILLGVGIVSVIALIRNPPTTWTIEVAIPVVGLIGMGMIVLAAIANNGSALIGGSILVAGALIAAACARGRDRG